MTDVGRVGLDLEYFNRDCFTTLDRPRSISQQLNPRTCPSFSNFFRALWPAGVTFHNFSSAQNLSAAMDTGRIDTEMAFYAITWDRFKGGQPGGPIQREGTGEQEEKRRWLYVWHSLSRLTATYHRDLEIHLPKTFWTNVHDGIIRNFSWEIWTICAFSYAVCSVLLFLISSSRPSPQSKAASKGAEDDKIPPNTEEKERIISTNNLIRLLLGTVFLTAFPYFFSLQLTIENISARRRAPFTSIPQLLKLVTEGRLKISFQNRHNSVVRSMNATISGIRQAFQRNGPKFYGVQKIRQVCHSLLAEGSTEIFIGNLDMPRECRTKCLVRSELIESLFYTAPQGFRFSANRSSVSDFLERAAQASILGAEMEANGERFRNRLLPQGDDQATPPTRSCSENPNRLYVPAGLASFYGAIELWAAGHVFAGLALATECSFHALSRYIQSELHEYQWSTYA